MSGRYKWSHPRDWLDDYLTRHADDAERLLAEAKVLAGLLDSDEIQDEYQREMDEDGYFEEIQTDD